MKIKTSDLKGRTLDWAVCRAQHPEAGMSATHVWLDTGDGEDDFLIGKTSTDRAQGWPIIEQELSKVFRNVGGTWSAMILKDLPLTPDERGTSLALSRRAQWNGAGPTPLIAAMRCYCSSKLGDEIDIPEELCQSQNS